MQGCVYDADLTIQSKAERKGPPFQKQQHKGGNKAVDILFEKSLLTSLYQREGLFPFWQREARGDFQIDVYSIMRTAIKGRQMMGYDFHRQKPIDNFIVDFFCRELMLEIEVDGYTHTFKEVAGRVRREGAETEGVRCEGYTVQG